MDLHDTSQDLPPLRKKKSKGQINIEKNIKVQNFIKSKLLLDYEFYQLFMDISKKSEEILKIIDLFNNTNIESKNLLNELDFRDEIPKKALKEISSNLDIQDGIKIIKRRINYFKKNIRTNINSKNKIEEEILNKQSNVDNIKNSLSNLEYYLYIIKENSNQIDIDVNSLNNLELSYNKKLKILKIETAELDNSKKRLKVIINKNRHFKNQNKKLREIKRNLEKILKKQPSKYEIILNEIDANSNHIQNKINSFEDERGLNLDILSNTLLYVCEECGFVISLGRFRKTECDCGKKIEDPTQTNPLIIYHFNRELINFINKNNWLEYGADYLLKRKKFDSWVGYHILGHSGIWHEIDNIAEYKINNQKFRTFCECKSGKIKANDILIFSGKIADIGCSSGYMFTSQKEKYITPEILRLSKTKNIKIIAGLLENDIENLIKEIN